MGHLAAKGEAQMRNLLLLSCTAIVLLFTASPPLGASQEKQPPLASSVVADPFIGTWRLNTDKSSRSGIEKESITIESWGNEFKFLVDSLGENGAHLHYWFVTDMKGGAAKHTQVDGRPMSSESCITRLDSNRFVNDTAVPTARL